MNNEKARYYAENMEEITRRDRVFLNNPVIVHTLGIAPLVLVATSLSNALMMFVAVLLLLTPVRVAVQLLSSRLSGMLRAIAMCLAAAVWYIPVYLVLVQLFHRELLSLGIYLPMLVMEPLILQRFEHTPDETPGMAVRKGLGFTVGYGLVLVLLGALREILGAGTLMGVHITDTLLFPIAQLPAGGFLLLGVLSAAWCAGISYFKKVVNMEAKRGL